MGAMPAGAARLSRANSLAAARGPEPRVQRYFL
jgi:hypothetical protein